MSKRVVYNVTTGQQTIEDYEPVPNDEHLPPEITLQEIASRVEDIELFITTEL